MNPRTSEQFEQIRDQREGKILLAGLRLFARQGFKATRISEITELAGASHGLFYHYFDSKEVLFNALVDMAVDSSNGFMLNIEAMPLAPLDQIHAIAEGILLSLKETDDSAFFFLLIVQAAVSEAAPEAARHRAQSQVLPFEVLIRIITAGQKDGSIHQADPRQMAEAFLCAIHGMAVYYVMSDGNLSLTPEVLMALFQCPQTIKQIEK